MAARPVLEQREIAYIHANYKEKTIKEIEAIIGRHTETIRKYCNRNNLEYKRGPTSPMTATEKNFIKDNYKVMTHAEIAKHLDKAPGGISRFCKVNGLTKRLKSIEHKEEIAAEKRKAREGKPYLRPDKITTPHQAHIHQVIGKWSF
jgi:hypothetical protein